MRHREVIFIAALIIPLLSLTISVAHADPPYAFNGSLAKFAGNPILTPTAGSWDSEFVVSPRVIHDSVYRMWYAGGSGGITGIGYATSNDGFSWTKHAGPVLSPGASGAWDSGEVELGSVVWNGSLYLMLYRGANTTLSTSGAVGLATSQDGTTWTKYAGNPVLVPTAFGLDQRFLATPFMIKMALTYNMWYMGQSGVVASSNPSSSILYATSYNGKSWDKWPGEVLSPSSDTNAWDSGSLYAPAIAFDGVDFGMWYSALDHNYARPQIGFATSPDGSTWTRSSTSPVLSPGGAGSWDSRGVEQPDAIASGNGFLLYYDGFSDSTGGRIGVALGPLGTPIPELPHLSFNVFLALAVCATLGSLAAMKRRRLLNED